MPRRYFYKTQNGPTLDMRLEIERQRWNKIWFALTCLFLVGIFWSAQPPIVKFPAPPQPMFVTSAPPAGWLIRCMSIDPERKVIRPFWEDSGCIREAQQLEQAAIRMRGGKAAFSSE